MVGLLRLRAMRGLLSSVAALCFAALSMQMVMAAETDIDLTTPTGIVHGTLTMPDKPARGEPLALIVAGSGPTNRDGSSTMAVCHALSAARRSVGSGRPERALR